MKRFNSIKKNGDFQKVYRTGRSFADKIEGWQQCGASPHYTFNQGKLPAE